PVALEELEVLRDQKAEPRYREEGDGHRAARGAEAQIAEQAEVDHWLWGRSLAGDKDAEYGGGEREAAEAPGAAPAVGGGLDDRVDRRGHGGAREHQPRASGLVRARIPRGRHAPGDERGADSSNGCHREEDARPPELLEQPASDDRPERDRHADGRPPEADRA